MSERRIPPGQRVLLLFPSMQERLYGNRWRLTESPTAPLGLLYLAPPLIKAGYTVKFVDLSVDRLRKDEYLRVLRNSDFILISCYSQALSNVYRIIDDIRSIHKDAWIICGGPHCNETDHHVDGADLTVYGEAEDIIAEILDRISFERPLAGIPGISYLRNGSLLRNPGFNAIQDLDSIDSPSFDLARNKKYGYLYGLKVNNIAGIITSRGCPYECTFCTFRRITYRERSVGNVIQEIKKRREEGADYLVFYDDNFLMNKTRAREIMSEMIKNKIPLKMSVQGRVDFVDQDLLKILKAAGVIIMIFGVESANQDVLDFYNKKTTVASTEQAISLADLFGMITFGTLIIGAPMERESHFETNKRFFKKVPLDLISIHILNYVCGSKLWEQAVRNGLIEEHEIHVAADKRLSPYTTEELDRIRSELIKFFYHNPRRFLRLAHKFMAVLGVRYIFKLIIMYLKGTVYRPATKFHGADTTNVSLPMIRTSTKSGS